MVKLSLILLLLVAFLISGCSSASVSPAAKIVGGVVTNVASALFKWLWSLKSTTKTEISSRSMMKFEGGYTVETVFDGSKLGIEPYYVEVSPSGNLMILDSQNSNIYSISTPFSRYSRPKLIAGSPEGYSGHIDGKSREARMNHPKGFTMDDRGNIYVADTMNMAIRKISDYGVVTIAGGKWSRGGGGGHIDGPSEDAKFSDDFDVVYVGSSCSLLIVDRGNQAIREIQLRDDDCPEKYEDSEQLVSGMAVLFAAAFFGYMLALLQMRIVAMFSSDSVAKVNAEGVPAGTYNRQQKYIQPPLIPTEDEYEKSGEGLFDSMGRLFLNTGSAIVEILGGLFTGSRRKPIHRPNQHHFRDTSRHSSNPWPTAMQESFMIPDEDEPPPPSLESSRDYPTPRKPYPVMTNEMDNSRNYKQNRTFYGGRDVDFPQQQQHHHQVHHFKKQPHPLQQQQQHYQKHQQSDAQTYYEQDCEKKEIVFGAVQEECGRREAMVIKAVHHEDPIYTNYNIRSRYNYTGYSYGY